MVNGIDYGNGKTNINIKTGIRYGVLPVNDVGQAWVDDAESDYGDPTCPECGEIVDTAADNCGSCNDELDDDCYPDSPLSWYVDTPELKATQSGDDCDIFIVESEYYTRAGFARLARQARVTYVMPIQWVNSAIVLGMNGLKTVKPPIPCFGCPIMSRFPLLNNRARPTLWCTFQNYSEKIGLARLTIRHGGVYLNS